MNTLERSIGTAEVGDATPMDYVFDARWVTGGIGRFATEVRSRLRPPHVIMPNGRRASSPWSSVRIGWQLGREGWPLLFTPGYLPPIGGERRSIVSVHDLMYVRGGAAATRARGAYFDLVVRRQLRYCRRIVTGSTFVRDQIDAWLGRDGPAIDIVGYGLTDELIPGDDLIQACRTGGAWLFLGGDKVNKNLPGALDAWRRSELATRGHRLIVVGSVAEAGRREYPGVSYTGLVPDRRLRELYATASYLLMPSLDEGYGLPALEGIAARIPVVFGDVGPLAEVVGDCGIAVDPTDAGSTADAMRDMVSGSWDEQLAVGSAAARQHTWDDVAARVDRCIRSVAS